MFTTLRQKKELQFIYLSLQSTANWLELVTCLASLKKQEATVLPDSEDYQVIVGEDFQPTDAEGRGEAGGWSQGSPNVPCLSYPHSILSSN